MGVALGVQVLSPVQVAAVVDTPEQSLHLQRPLTPTQSAQVELGARLVQTDSLEKLVVLVW
jgi:hypothetical protein